MVRVYCHDCLAPIIEQFACVARIWRETGIDGWLVEPRPEYNPAVVVQHIIQKFEGKILAVIVEPWQKAGVDAG